MKNNIIFYNYIKNITMKINNWYGRLGNNIKTLINCLHLAISLDIDIIIIPQHEMFNNKVIYRYIPRSFAEDQENPPPLKDLYGSMFEGVEPREGTFYEEKVRELRNLA